MEKTFEQIAAYELGYSWGCAYASEFYVPPMAGVKAQCLEYFGDDQALRLEFFEGYSLALKKTQSTLN